MNSKKAKKLRRLAEHLQAKGVITNPEWEDAGYLKHEAPVLRVFGDQRDGPVPTSYQRVLDPHCGKSVYRKMKQRAQLNGRH